MLAQENEKNKEKAFKEDSIDYNSRNRGRKDMHDCTKERKKAIAYSTTKKDEIKKKEHKQKKKESWELFFSDGDTSVGKLGASHRYKEIKMTEREVGGRGLQEFQSRSGRIGGKYFFHRKQTNEGTNVRTISHLDTKYWRRRDIYKFSRPGWPKRC